MARRPFLYISFAPSLLEGVHEIHPTAKEKGLHESLLESGLIWELLPVVL